MRMQMKSNDLYLLYDIDPSQTIHDLNVPPIMIISSTKSTGNEIVVITHLDETGVVNPDKVTYINATVKIKSKKNIKQVLDLFLNIQSLETLTNFIELL